ncbi:MAG: acyltransferase family protein, partial [Candidatus Saccharibacteria bacterium]|nr:acyltransferase family protein [Candidatus Saccharibacteria bacterium]
EEEMKKENNLKKSDEVLSFAVVPTRPKSRVYYLDVLRVIACMAVILIHASAPYLGKDLGSFNFWVGNVLDSLSRIAVPLFVMISGALILNEKYAYKSEKIKKHIIKLAVFFIFWSAFYTLIFGIIYKIVVGESIDVLDIALTFIKGHYHLWFIYLIIGLYLIVPLLRLWVKKENKKYVQYFIILSLIFAFLLPQIIEIGSHYSDKFDIFEKLLDTKLALCYIGGYTAYFLLGWYLNTFDIKNKKMIYCFGIISVFVTIMGTYLLSVTTNQAMQLYSNLGLNVLLQSVAVFVFVKSRLNTTSTKERKIVKTISKYSLGVYAIHALIVEIAYMALKFVGMNEAMVAIPIVFVLAFSVSFLASAIMSRVPLFRNVV